MIAEIVGVLAQQEGDFRVDFATDQKCRGVLGNTLGQHHQLVGGGNVACRSTGLQFEGGNLFGQFENVTVLVVHQGDVLAQGHQVLLLADHDGGVLVGLHPELFQGFKLFLHGRG